MRNFKLGIEYDGTDFHGWQRQPGLRTVQGLIEEAFAGIVGKEVQLNGAGRTDAGVHALAQVGNTVIDTSLEPVQLGKALASKLPVDIHVYSIEEVDMKFHARFSATNRRYSYYLRTEPTAIWRRFAYVVTPPLDLDEMRNAAASMVGDQDFTSFTPTRTADEHPTQCDVRHVDVTQHDEIVAVTVEADHFLHHMVRVIVGTLLEVGRGRYGAEHIEEILCKKDRNLAGPTVPPNGLFLTDVGYK